MIISLAYLTYCDKVRTSPAIKAVLLGAGFAHTRGLHCPMYHSAPVWFCVPSHDRAGVSEAKMADIDFSLGMIIQPDDQWGMRVADFGEREDFLIEGRAYLDGPHAVSEIHVWTGFNRKTLSNEYDEREGPFADYLARLIEHRHSDEMARAWLVDGELTHGDTVYEGARQ